MKKIIINSLLIGGLGLTLILSMRVFQMTHPEHHSDSSLFLYGKGNASGEVRAEIP